MCSHLLHPGAPALGLDDAQHFGKDFFLFRLRQSSRATAHFSDPDPPFCLSGEKKDFFADSIFIVEFTSNITTTTNTTTT